jgi:hypothetical protein
MKTHLETENRKVNRTNGMSTLILPSEKDDSTGTCRLKTERLNKKWRHVLGLIDPLKQLVLFNN